MRDEGSIGTLAAGMEQWLAREDTPEARAAFEMVACAVISIVHLNDAFASLLKALSKR